MEARVPVVEAEGEDGKLRVMLTKCECCGERELVIQQISNLTDEPVDEITVPVRMMQEMILELQKMELTGDINEN